MENRVEDENGKLKVAICEYAKKKSPDGDRYLPLNDYEIKLFQTVKRINEEVGMRMGILSSVMKKAELKFVRSITVSVLSYRRTGIEVKSVHDIRRTIASEMDRRSIEMEDIHWYLGHNDINTTSSYILNNQGKKMTARQDSNKSPHIRILINRRFATSVI